MLVLPALVAAMIGAHLYLVARLGTTAPPWMRAEIPDEARSEDA
jgi:quinol-cytochrome oxidoreductase complex cytochrome b subunit